MCVGGGGARAGAAGLSLQKSVNITTVNQLLFGGVCVGGGCKGWCCWSVSAKVSKHNNSKPTAVWWCVCVGGGGGARAGAAGLSLQKSVNITTVNQLLFGGVCVGGGGVQGLVLLVCLCKSQ